jgi:hypothetical protein
LEADVVGAAIAIGGAGFAGLDTAEARGAGAVLTDFIRSTAGDIDAAAAEAAGIALTGAERGGLGASLVSGSFGVGPRLIGLSLGLGPRLVRGGTGRLALIAAGACRQAVAAAGAVRGRDSSVSTEADRASSEQSGESSQRATAGDSTGETPGEGVESGIIHDSSSCFRELSYA